MVEKEDSKAFTRKMTPRAFKAFLLAVISYLPMYFLSALVSPVEAFFPWYAPLTNTFVVVFTFFLVAGVILSGTIFQYVFGVARTLVFMIFLIFVLNGGVITLDLPMEGTAASVMVDLTAFLAMLVLLCLLGIGKQVVEIIDFVARKNDAEEV